MDLSDFICCTSKPYTEMGALTAREEADAKILFKAQDISDFTESTNEDVINTQPEISAEGKVDAV